MKLSHVRYFKLGTYLNDTVLVEFLDEEGAIIGSCDLDEAPDRLVDEFSELRYALKDSPAHEIRIEGQVFDANLTTSLRSVGGFSWARDFILGRLGFVVTKA